MLHSVWLSLQHPEHRHNVSILCVSVGCVLHACWVPSSMITLLLISGVLPWLLQVGASLFLMPEHPPLTFV